MSWVTNGDRHRADLHQEPVDQSVVVGDSVTFSTATEGTGPISYQWFFNQTPLPG
jgi:hypothetical protein